jgi:hypothetical protein
VATHTDDAGRAVCVFCLDSVLCPEMKRFLQEQERRSASNSQEDKQVNHSDAIPTRPSVPTPEAATTPASVAPAKARRCRVLNCVTVLGKQNRSGFCSRHFHRSEAKPRVNGRGSAPRANGHALTSEKTNGLAIAASQIKAKTPSAPTCKAPGCGAELAPQNKSGFCRQHFYLSRSRTLASGRASTERPSGHAAAAPGKTNGRAVAASIPIDEIRRNGHAGVASNSNGHDHTSEERLNSVLLAWPIEQKLKVVNAWLTAAI